VTAPAFGSAAELIERDASGRPLIKSVDDPDTLIPYERASSYGKAIDNGAGLLYWAKCMAVKGTAMSPSIVKAAKPLDYYDESGQGKKGLYELAEKALNLAGANDKATEGTAMHSYTELIDRGEELPPGLDPGTEADLEAYKAVTAGLVYPAIEEFVVVDEVHVAGSFDRGITVPKGLPGWPEWLATGDTYIGDLKTGNAEGAIASILVQLALYSRGKRYNPTTGERTPLGFRQDVGLIVHLPLGKGTAQIIAVDLTLGWAGVLASQTARAFQAAAKLGCKSCNEGSGFYKNGNPCRSCKGVPRVPAGVTVRAVRAA
jgi:hypothetical protein